VGPAIQTNVSQTIDSITLPGNGNWVVTAKFIANNAGPIDPANVSCDLQIGGVSKDNLGAAGTDFGLGDGAHTLTGAGAGATAAIVCTTTAGSGNYRAISFTAIQVSSIS
jgi:hypothetical protein